MKYCVTALLLLLGATLHAQDGYEIKVTLRPFTQGYLYLGHYYGKTTAVVDSARLNDKSEAVFRGTKKLGGGIYLIGDPGRGRSFEFLVDKNQRFAITADTANLTQVSFTGSPENVEFKAYQDYMNRTGRALEGLQARRSGPDSVQVKKEMETLQTGIRAYRNKIMSAAPESLLATVLQAMREPEVPANPNPADSLFAWRHYKARYWEGVDFWDDRLLRTPFFEARLDKYMDQVVFPAADSVVRALDWMLGYASASADMQQYLLIKFLNRYLNQKYMWEDAVFVHLFEKYISNKTYPWLNEPNRKVITDRAYSLMANIMGAPAAEIELPDPRGVKKSLYALEAPYVLVAIWDPTCGHCKEVLPRIDSLYRAKWKARGLRVYAMAKETEGKHADWLSFIEQHKIGDWSHVYYSKAAETARVQAGTPSYGQLYDVQSFPTLYLLDKDKRIIAKKLSVEQIDEVLGVRN